MKPTPSKKKKLSKQTLRKLSLPAVSSVQGGAVPRTVGCDTNTCDCPSASCFNGC